VVRWGLAKSAELGKEDTISIKNFLEPVGIYFD
jgi:hypothetical protein